MYAHQFLPTSLTYEEFRKLPRSLRREFTNGLSADEFVAFTCALVHFMSNGAAELNPMTLGQIMESGHEISSSVVPS